MDRNHLEDKEGCRYNRVGLLPLSSITKDRVGVDSTIKEGFIQQNPSTEDNQRVDSRMESWFTSSSSSETSGR